MEVISIILSSIFVITVVSRIGLLLVRHSIEYRKNNPLFVCILNDLINIFILTFVIILIVFYFTHR